MRGIDKMKRQYILVVAVVAFLGLFLLYPAGYILRGAFVEEGKFTFDFFRLAFQSPVVARALGMIGMMILTVSPVMASRVLGKQLGQLFRAG